MTTTVQQRAGILEERLTASEDRLAPAERRVARFFTEHREEVAFLSAADVAETLGTSGATVVRAAQALGYAGFPELKDELREALRSRSSPVARLGRSLDEIGGDPGAVLDHVLARTAELLAEARRSIRTEDFGRALDVLRAARRIVVIGVGPNRGIADHVAQSLRRFGRHTFHVTSRAHGMAEELMELAAGDALLVIAHERVTPETSVPLDLARERGIPSVLVTDHLALALEGRYTVALSARRGEADSYPISGVTLIVLEALLVGLAARDRARTLASLEELKAVRERLGL